MPSPESADFSALLSRYRAAGLPMVGIGSWGPSMPQASAPIPDAPTVEQLDKDLKEIATSRWGWVAIYQPDDGFLGVLTARDREDAQRREQLWEQQLKPWLPRRHPAMCMRASHSRHVLLAPDDELALLLELRGEDGERMRDEAETRPESIAAAVERGDSIWAALGAWPWSAFPGGRPPPRWWQDPRAAQSLQAAVSAQAEELATRLRRACYLLDALITS